MSYHEHIEQNPGTPQPSVVFLYLMSTYNGLPDDNARREFLNNLNTPVGERLRVQPANLAAPALFSAWLSGQTEHSLRPDHEVMDEIEAGMVLQAVVSPLVTMTRRELLEEAPVGGNFITHRLKKRELYTTPEGEVIEDVRTKRWHNSEIDARGSRIGYFFEAPYTPAKKEGDQAQPQRLDVTFALGQDRTKTFFQTQFAFEGDVVRSIKCRTEGSDGAEDRHLYEWGTRPNWLIDGLLADQDRARREDADYRNAVGMVIGPREDSRGYDSIIETSFNFQNDRLTFERQESTRGSKGIVQKGKRYRYTYDTEKGVFECYQVARTGEQACPELNTSLASTEAALETLVHLLPKLEYGFSV